MTKSKKKGRRKRQENALRGLDAEAREYEESTGYSMDEGTFTPRFQRVARERSTLRLRLNLNTVELNNKR